MYKVWFKESVFEFYSLVCEEHDTLKEAEDFFDRIKGNKDISEIWITDEDGDLVG